ncbi:MAG: PAS domain-containing protein [Chloroflexales bacterium]|nr:PAS domain-containing protein [Chloroflexales bacterium]
MTPPILGAPVQQALLPFLALDAEARILALNEAAATLYGRPAAGLIATPFAEVVDLYSREKAALMVAQAMAEGVTYDWELNHPRVDAPPTLVTYTAWIWRAAPGAPLAVAAIGRPIDAATSLAGQLAATNQQLEGALLQLERAHTALKAAQVQLVRSEKMRALGQLVAGVAHEVNTPLAFVANNLDFLAESLQALRDLHASYHDLVADTPGLAARLRAADDAAGVEQIWADLDELVPDSRDGVARIATIVQALRVFARPDDPGTQAADLNAGLASTVRIARASAQAGVVISERYGQIPPVVCNPGQINQVALNLLTNAIQAIQGAGEVVVSSSCEDAMAVVTVSDTGPGMDEATLARLGEPFFTTRPVGAGTGLGIAISRGIVERHGGRLEFDSAPGRGTTARLLLPLGGPLTQ